MLLWNLMRRKCFGTKTMTEVKKNIYEKEKTRINSGIFSRINQKQKEKKCSVFVS